MDITSINFKDIFFDIVICNHVFEHIQDDIKAMSEILRVLEKGGLAILQVPIDENLLETFEDDTVISPKERKKAFGQSDHVRQYSNDYAERLKKRWL